MTDHSAPTTHEPAGLDLGDWEAELLTADEWRDQRAPGGRLDRYAGMPVTQPYVYVIYKPTTSSRPIMGEEVGHVGTFVAPCFVAEPSREALLVAILNAIAHETLEWAKVGGELLCDPHSPDGEQVLVGALSKWLAWTTHKDVVLKSPRTKPPTQSRSKQRRRGNGRT
jgi:hypothetical protein